MSTSPLVDPRDGALKTEHCRSVQTFRPLTSELYSASPRPFETYTHPAIRLPFSIITPPPFHRFKGARACPPIFLWRYKTRSAI